MYLKFNFFNSLLCTVQFVSNRIKCFKIIKVKSKGIVSGRKSVCTLVPTRDSKPASLHHPGANITKNYRGHFTDLNGENFLIYDSQRFNLSFQHKKKAS